MLFIRSYRYTQSRIMKKKKNSRIMLKKVLNFTTFFRQSLLPTLVLLEGGAL